MLPFYMDHHIHRSITEQLRLREIEVITAFEDNIARADDEVLLARATSLGYVVVTQDDDFLEIAARWQRETREFSGIVFAIQQHIDIGGTVEYLELISQLKSADEMRNRVEFVPVRK